MSVIFKQLETLLTEHFFTEKVFVVPSHRDGKLAILGLAKRGHAVLNVKVKTFQDLALEQVHSYLHKNNLAILPSVIGKQFIFQALKQLKKQKELTYFKDVQLTPSFCDAFYQSLLDMKQVKINLENFPADAFLNGEKAQDIQKVFMMYEAKRKEASFIDVADLFQIASKLESPSATETIYVYFPHEAYHVTEKEFFFQYTKHKTVVAIDLPEVDGLASPAAMVKSDKSITTNHPFRNLYDVEKAIGEGIPSFSIAAMISEDEEIQSVFRRLKQETIAFDEVALFYTSRRPYIESLLRLQQKLHLPITFGEGIPMELTKPGKLLRGFFRWIREDYSVETLAKLLRENAFDYEALPMSGERMIKLLKDCRIRWGKDRYLQKLNEKLAYFEKKQSEEGINLEDRIEEYKQLSKWIHAFLSLSPAAKTWESVRYKDWLGHVKVLISTYANGGRTYEQEYKQPMDKLAKEVMTSALEQVMEVQNEILTLGEAIAFTEQWLMTLPVGARNPLPGHLHVSSYRNGLYVDRKHVFLVGMDNGRFPGRVKEDPLLLDRERKKIHDEMTLGKAFVKRNAYFFVQLLLTTTAPVYFSFPFMDTVENRQSSPAHLFLQLFRMKTKDPDSTGETLMEHLQGDVHFVREDVSSMLQQTEWLGAQIWHNKELEEALLHEGSFENIIQGFTAKQARLTEMVSEYDGFIAYDGVHLDPRESNFMLSTSKLEQLGACPYSYFLQHVLKVEEEETEEFDRYAWLDAADRGSVLHEVFERFYLTLKEKGEKPKFKEHYNLIFSICDNVLLEKREYQLPPSDMVYELERQEMLESCSLFLKAEEEASLDGEPLFFEYTFGMDGNAPAVIDLPNGSQLHLRGKIDRIDRLPDGTFSIVDYKTGSAYGYTDKAYFNGARKLQHILYALAFEKLNEGDGVRVSSSVYVFPTLKGQGARAYRKHTEERTEAFLQIIDNLCHYLKEGHFPYTDNPDDCKFCSFKSVCARHTYGEELLTKKAQDEKATGWRALMEVRKHD